jgi:HPt (histidine-containing phosphotransfer) domain-containing protein
MPPIDPTVLGELRDAVGGDLTPIVQTFSRMLRETAPRIVALVQEGDAMGAARLAHQLKGAAGNVGAAPLAALAQRIEQAGRGGDPSALLPLADALVPLADQTAVALSAWATPAA